MNDHPLAHSRYAIQGYEGSFHHEAASVFADRAIANEELICCETFYEVLQQTKVGLGNVVGLMAVENTTVGTILQNYELLHHVDLHIIGEVYLHIGLNLIASKEATMDTIKEVHSHRIAIQQCLRFLQSHDWKLVETRDTAYSVKQISAFPTNTVVAIGSKHAAKLYNLSILYPNINNYQVNYTRFLVLAPQPSVTDPSKKGKASIRFVANHAKGQLAKVLSCIADYDMNLSKLQSVPVPNTPFQYAFYVDIEFDSVDILHQALQKASSFFDSMRLYGIYNKGTLHTHS